MFGFVREMKQLNIGIITTNNMNIKVINNISDDVFVDYFKNIFEKTFS